MWVLFVGLEKKQKYSEMEQHVKHWNDKTYEGIEIDRNGISGQTAYKLDGLKQTLFKN